MSFLETPAVELFSAVDPIYRVDRSVRYWTAFNGAKSETLTDYAPVLERALALCQEHGVCLVDRSDRDSGFLRSTLGR